MSDSYTFETPEAMINFGKTLSSKTKKLLLEGELGAGKTTITKGFAAGLGINPENVQSPTYVYFHVYENKLLHIDMRRITAPEQLHELGILDMIDQYEYCIIEWPKRTELYADTSWTTLRIEKQQTGRTIELYTP